jgi:RyR domain.
MTLPKNTYTPSPEDTLSIELNSDILALTEQIAANVHEVWAEKRMAEGWRFDEEMSDVKKTHPCLIPYDKLPESEKEYDRKTALETLKLIVKSGFSIKKK